MFTPVHVQNVNEGHWPQPVVHKVWGWDFVVYPFNEQREDRFLCTKVTNIALPTIAATAIVNFIGGTVLWLLVVKPWTVITGDDSAASPFSNFMNEFEVPVLSLLIGLNPFFATFSMMSVMRAKTKGLFAFILIQIAFLFVVIRPVAADVLQPLSLADFGRKQTFGTATLTSVLIPWLIFVVISIRMLFLIRRFYRRRELAINPQLRSTSCWMAHFDAM